MEYRDVHRSGESVITYLELIDKSDMSQQQKANITKFISDLRIGKAGAKVKDRRISAYLQFLMKLHRYFKKDLDKITEKEATDFYIALQEDKIKKNNGMPYAQASKDEFVKTLKRYLGWKWGGRETIEYKKSLSWMKEDYKKSNKNAITLKEAKQIIDKEKYVRDKCLFLFLFDSGARIEEALNVRIGDLTKSSDHKFYMVHLRGTKTEEADRNISLPLCAKEINIWLKEHPTGDKDDYLFPIRYDNARRIIKGMSKRILNYQLKPHELRHSSATYYIQKFGAENVGGFYYRFGWKFGSKEANTYIKTHLFGGEIGQKQVIKSVENGRVQELEIEVEDMKGLMGLQKEQTDLLKKQIKVLTQIGIKSFISTPTKEEKKKAEELLIRIGGTPFKKLTWKKKQ